MADWPPPCQRQSGGVSQCRDVSSSLEVRHAVCHCLNLKYSSQYTGYVLYRFKMLFIHAVVYISKYAPVVLPFVYQWPCLFRLWPTLHLDPLSPREVRSVVNAECQSMDLKFTKDQVSYHPTIPLFKNIEEIWNVERQLESLADVCFLGECQPWMLYLCSRRKSWKGTVELHRPAMHCMSHYWQGWSSG